MVEAAFPFPRPEGLLEVTLTWPRMNGYCGPAWPDFCIIYVFIGDKFIDSRVVPFEDDAETEDMVRYSKAIRDIKKWVLAFRIPVASDWPDMSLDLLVERVDSKLRRRNLVVTRGGPHTSRYTAVIGRARVGLLDAVGIGDLDDDEGEDKKKMCRNEVGDRRLEGTVPFGKTVPLLDWELPAPGDADAKPRSVVRGTVDVRMSLKRLT
ncbi:hypothetical protein BS78_01G412900 [Paspalum vaginatum]|nr:hypothetical protein BS78_01G412900 [Paspalum vaginatum]